MAHLKKAIWSWSAMQPARDASPVVELSSVDLTYQSGEVEVRALRDVKLRINGGDYLSVVGPSGSGKSSLLNILGLLDRPSGGEYRFEGRDVSDLSEGDRTALRGQRIGFVFQEFHLLPNRTVLENVMVAMLYNRWPRPTRERLARDSLERVGLGHRMDFRPGTLSGGERQRVAIARATVARPSLLLCDEPTGNLDSATSEAILGLFEELRDDGLTLIVVTHDEQVSAHARRTVSMWDGSLSEEDRGG